MALQLSEFIATSFKKKVNQTCYFTSFFSEKKDEDLPFIKAGYVVLKESRKNSTKNIPKQETLSISRSIFRGSSSPLTESTDKTTEATPWHPCTERALQCLVQGQAHTLQAEQGPTGMDSCVLLDPERNLHWAAVSSTHTSWTRLGEFFLSLYSTEYKGLRLLSKPQVN